MTRMFLAILALSMTASVAVCIEDEPNGATPAGAAASIAEPITVTVPTVKTEYVDRQTPNGVVKTPVQKIIYEQRQVPKPTAEESQRLREELRALSDQKAELLDSGELIETVSRTRQEVAELKAWVKLIEVRKSLEALCEEHPATEASRVALELLGRIPAQRPGAASNSPFPESLAPVYDEPRNYPPRRRNRPPQEANHREPSLGPVIRLRLRRRCISVHHHR